MIEENLQTPCYKQQLELYEKTRLEYSLLNKEKQEALIQFCNISIQEKYSCYKFIEESAKYMVTDDVRWYALGCACAEKILQSKSSLINFYQWFKQYNYTNAAIFYNKILCNKLENIDLLHKYEEKLDVGNIVEHLNKTSLDYVQKSDKDMFCQFLEKENKDILNVFDTKQRMHYRYISDGFLYFALMPVLDKNTHLSVRILSRVENIFLLEEFLSLNFIRYDINLICKILSHIPKITNKSGNWDNRKYLLPLLMLTFNEYLLYTFQKCKTDNNVNEEDVLKNHTKQFINTLTSRDDCYFITEKWLLHLACSLNSKSDDLQKIICIQIQIIGSEITNQKQDFKNQFFNKEKDGNNQKELLLALIYITETMNFPVEYFDLFQKYILNLSNKIFISNDKTFIKTEHYLLSQLFVSIYRPDVTWKKLWNKLYFERQNAIHSKYNDNMRNISHSQYLILIGIAAVEYHISDKTNDLAIALLNKIWQALLELYLTIKCFLHEDFLNFMITRYIILKNITKTNYMPEITMVENNPELISNIIINLKNNNASLDFLFNEKNILNSIGAHLKLQKNSNRKHLKYKENYYDELEYIYTKYSRN